MLELPEEPYYLHDVPADMDTLIYQYICESETHSSQEIEEHWQDAFKESSDVDVELDLGMLELDMIQDLPGFSGEELLHYKEALGDLPPLLQNGLEFVDGRHRACLYLRLGYEKAVSIDLKASGIDVQIPSSQTNQLY